MPKVGAQLHPVRPSLIKVRPFHRPAGVQVLTRREVMRRVQRAIRRAGSGREWAFQLGLQESEVCRAKRGHHFHPRILDAIGLEIYIQRVRYLWVVARPRRG